MTRTDATAALGGTTPTQRRGRRAAMLAAVIAVPLAVAGLVAAAIGGADDRLDAIPAIVVNNDEMVTMTTPEGEEQPVLAGRQLVTELTGDGETGFDWTISNDEQAAEALAEGEAYAVLTIPADFSESVTSLAGDAPTTAALDIRTDDAHGYLAGTVASTVGDAIANAFGQQLTTQYLEGLYGNLIQVGGAFGDAADGAGQLADGADSLASGLDQLATGVDSSAAGAQELAGGLGQLAGGVGSAASGADQAAAGAATYADGVDDYTAGVDALAGGLGELQENADGLSALPQGFRDYAAGIRQAGTALVDGTPVSPFGWSAYVGTAEAANTQFQQMAAQIVAADPSLADEVAQLGTQLGTLAAAGDPLVAGTQGAFETLAVSGEDSAAELEPQIGALQGGIAEAAGGAAQLSGGSAQLRAGADGLTSGYEGIAGGLTELQAGASGAAAGTSELAGGLTQLGSGASASADGAAELADGTGELADGLAEGAEGSSSLTDLDPEETASVVAEPVTMAAERDNAIDSLGQVIAMLLAPIGLWLGAMALFLVFRPFNREALASTAPTGRLVGRTLFRGSLIGLAQAALVVLLMHTALGVDWALLPQTLAFSALLAVAFTAIHAFLSAWLGRIGSIVSLVLVVLQLAASGGLYPLEVVSGPFQAISPFLPLTWAVEGMQLIVSGAGGGAVAGAAAVVALFGLLGAVGTGIVVARRRGIRPAGSVVAARPVTA